MPKITVNNISTLEDNSSLAKLNENFQTIVNEFDNVVSRDGTSPSSMTSDLDMNSNQILNLPDAVNAQEPATLSQLQEVVVGAGTTEPSVFNTKTSVGLASIDSSINAIRTSGYSSAGDGGGALYKRVSSEPSHEGKVQSADGAWWELAEPIVIFKMFGALGNNTLLSQNTQIQHAIDFVEAKGGGEVWGTDGIYLVSSSISLPATVRLRMSENCVLRATTTMDTIIDTPASERHNNGFISGGIIDCAELADRGMYLRSFSLLRVMNTRILGNKLYAIELGDNSAPNKSYEFFGHNILIRRAAGVTAPNNSTGIRFTRCGDSHLTDCVIMGQKFGVWGNADLSDSKFSRVHVWNTDTNGGVVNGFYIGGYSNILTQCQVDGPIVQDAYFLAEDWNVLVGCSTNMTPPSFGGTDGIANCVRIATGREASIIGCTWKGRADARFAADLVGDVSKVKTFGNIISNVITTYPERGLTLAKAWVHFDGTDGSIYSNFNVSSITRNGVGDYTVNIARTLVNTNFAVFCTGMTDGNVDNGLIGFEDSTGRTVFTVRVRFYDPITNQFADPSRANVMIFGTGLS